MSKFTFGFLGCGNMGGALALAVSEVVDGSKLAVCDNDITKTDFLTKNRKAVYADAETIAKDSEFIFLAVKPQGMNALFEQIRPVLQKRTDRFVLVSMAAGISMATIAEMVNLNCPIIRMMPNTPVRVGEGMILYAVNELVSEADVKNYLYALSHAGKTDEIPEHLIDAGGALSGCGPAFVYLFAEALADGGVSCGLPRDKALLYATQTLLGSAEMLLSTGEHPGKLKDAVCSPGGTTIAGVQALEQGAFRGTVMRAVNTAYEKTSKLK